MAAILRSDPPRFDRDGGDISEELERIVQKCLEGDRNLRYQSARELLADLRRLDRERVDGGASRRTASGFSRRLRRRPALVVLAGLAVLLVGTEVARRWTNVSSIRSIAVLPLVTVAVDPRLHYQTEGITDGLIDTLSRLPDLRVTSRRAVDRYRTDELNIVSVARELGVDAILTGRLVARGDVLTLRLELVNAADSSHIWGKQYDLTTSALLSLQRQIASELIEILRPSGARASGGISSGDTADPEAYRLYRLGRHSYQQYDRAGAIQAIEYYRQALARDANYALAYSGLAEAYLVGTGTGVAAREAHRLARDAATKAIAVDPDLSESHASLAAVLLNDDWNFSNAEYEYRRAIELNANNVEAHHQYAHFLLAVGRTDEALAAARRVIELEPVSIVTSGHMAYQLYYTRQFDAAIAAHQDHLSKWKEAGAHFTFGDAYARKGLERPAFDQYVAGHRESGATAAELAALTAAFAERGLRGYFQTRVRQLEARGRPEANRFPMTSLGGQLALLHALLGDKDRAFDQLERIYADRDRDCVHIREEIAFDALRPDPRFADLLRRIGLPPP